MAESDQRHEKWLCSYGGGENLVFCPWQETLLILIGFLNLLQIIYLILLNLFMIFYLIKISWIEQNREYTANTYSIDRLFALSDQMPSWQKIIWSNQEKNKANNRSFFKKNIRIGFITTQYNLFDKRPEITQGKIPGIESSTPRKSCLPSRVIRKRRLSISQNRPGSQKPHSMNISRARKTCCWRFPISGLPSCFRIWMNNYSEFKA